MFIKDSERKAVTISRGAFFLARKLLGETLSSDTSAGNELFWLRLTATIPLKMAAAKPLDGPPKGANRYPDAICLNLSPERAAPGTSC